MFFFGLKVLEERLPLRKGEGVFRELVKREGKDFCQKKTELCIAMNQSGMT